MTRKKKSAAPPRAKQETDQTFTAVGHNEPPSPISSSTSSPKQQQQHHHLPRWEYHGVDPLYHQQKEQQQKQQQRDGENGNVNNDDTTTTITPFPTLYSNEEEKTLLLDLGTYRREIVSNLDNNNINSSSNSRNSNDSNDDRGRIYFDQGLRLMFSYQHEMAAQHFLASLHYRPHCALSHGLLALCHSPNYNFKGEPYYLSTNHVDDSHKHDLSCVFPSQQVAHRHSQAGVDKIEDIMQLRKRAGAGASTSTTNAAAIGNNNSGSGRGKKGNKPKNKKGINTSIRTKDSTVSTTITTATNNDVDGNTASVASSSLLPDLISPIEVQLLHAIRILTCHPGVDPDLSEEIVGRPYANALRRIHVQYCCGNNNNENNAAADPLVTYCFCEALMVLNAWNLYSYPSGQPVSPDVLECKGVLERALQQFPHHAGLCHLYVHLMEMSATPQMALAACIPLRLEFPNAGHLIHMATHIDVLLGDYPSVVQYNENAVVADEHVATLFPRTAGPESFYFGYIVHNYHMAVYGAILGGMQQKATAMAQRLNAIVNETMLQEFPNLAPYLESYSALDIHVMIRFGQWQELIGGQWHYNNADRRDETSIAPIQPPRDAQLMLFRAASLAYGKGLAYATLSSSLSLSLSHEERLEYLRLARKQADRLDGLRGHVDAKFRILHNNSVADLLAVDATMLRGEIAYHTAAAAAKNDPDDNNKDNVKNTYNAAFDLLYKAVRMQDSLNYDEPWGKMQPVRHALGGLLLEQGRLQEARIVFQDDLKFHPKNPWALVGLVSCLEKMNANHHALGTGSSSTSTSVSGGSSCCSSLSKKNDIVNDKNEIVQQEEPEDLTATIAMLKEQLREQQAHEWADFNVVVPCECCCTLKTVIADKKNCDP